MHASLINGRYVITWPNGDRRIMSDREATVLRENIALSQPKGPRQLAALAQSAILEVASGL